MGLTLLAHGTLIILMPGGYWNLDTPAKSAAANAHQVHKNATIFGSNSPTTNLL